MTNKTPTEFNGYSLFTDIVNPAIRAWNRANTIYNIKERHGNAVASKYTQLLDKNDLLSVYTIMFAVKDEGYENVRRQIFRSEVNA